MMRRRLPKSTEQLHFLVTLQRSGASAPECYYILSQNERSAVIRARRIIGEEATLLDVRFA